MVLTRVMPLMVLTHLHFIWFVRVARPERPKVAKDEVRRPKVPSARGQGPEGPYASDIYSLKSGGLWTSSYAPFRRLGRVTHVPANVFDSVLLC